MTLLFWMIVGFLTRLIMTWLGRLTKDALFVGYQCLCDVSQYCSDKFKVIALAPLTPNPGYGVHTSQCDNVKHL